ncbi:MAG: PTS sugar transporter subunit IIA [Phycisphaerales bacterium]|nr:PTS sugar transporter subunit IIA [Phycisphaerales bacterium]
MDLLKLISPEVCRIPMQSSDRQGAIIELVEHLAELGMVDDVDRIAKVVWEREMQRTTGIGEGLAVPHGRCPTLKKLIIAMGVPPQPIDFQSFDRKPVQFIVLVLSPEEAITDHVQVLGAISRLMANPGFRRQAFAAESTQALSDLFCEELKKS